MTAGSRPGGAGAANAVDLPQPALVVLREAGAIVAGRPAATADLRHPTATTRGVRRLLELLEQSVSLRTATSLRPAVVELNLPHPARGTPGADPRQVAANLIDPAGTHIAAAVATVTSWLDAAQQTVKQARRESQRGPRLTAKQRAERRDRARIDELRTARDQARAQAEIYRAEAARLREQVSAQGEGIAALHQRLSAMNRRLGQARRTATEPTRLAEELAALLGPADTPVVPDGRAVQTGEPPRVDPGRRPPDPATGLDDRLRSAAAHAGLPDTVRDSVHAWLPELLSAFANPPRSRVTAAEELHLVVDVLGGGTQIGGSCVLISAGGTRILVDAGTRPSGTDEASLAPPRIKTALSAPLDAIVVTHAHNDHGGWVPAILRRQPRIPVLVTEATGELLATMWFDAAKVLAKRADGGPPSYGRDDVDHAVENLRTVSYSRRYRVGSLDLELFPAGHILGAAGAVIHAGDRRVVVSGDVSGPGQATVGGIAVPDSARHSDLLLLETTYADQGRTPPRQVVTVDLVNDVANTLDAGGRVLIPAFALGRAQEVALVLSEHLPEVEVLIDGLARDISEVYERHNGPGGNPLRIFAGNVRPVERGSRGEEMARLKSGVVIATSGMLTWGPAVEWARRILPDERSALMIVGYQDADSPGKHLLDLAERGGKTVALPREDGGVTEVTVAAQVKKYRLGAHASADELVSICADVRAAQVMLVHGTREGQEKFAGRLALRGQHTAAANRRWKPTKPEGGES
jgi:Cft2 family RNA processing exonuclease